MSNFKCGDIGLDVTSEYKYLGLWFIEFLYLQGTVKHIAYLRQEHWVKSYLSLNGQVVLFDCYKQLFDSMVKLVLLYGAGIWGAENRQVINTIQNKACGFFPRNAKNY